MTQANVVQTLLTAAVSLSLIACDEWPPYEQDIRDNLLENREVLEKLEAILDENGYGLISSTGTGSVKVAYEADGEIEYRYIDDDKGWGELLAKAKVMDISRNEDVFFFTISGSSDGDVFTYIDYAHHQDADPVLRVCLPNHRKIPCGECVVKLDEEWWAYYTWFPSSNSNDDLVSLANGKIDQATFDIRSKEASDKCWRDGYAAMGYETSDEPQR